MGKKVVVVEDNKLNQKLFYDLLEAQGYEPILTDNGYEALNLVRKHLPDLILMDIQLPEVSGLDVISWIKADETICDIPIIAVTAFAMKGDQERILERGCQAYMAKPISVSNFLTTVRSFIE